MTEPDSHDPAHSGNPIGVSVVVPVFRSGPTLGTLVDRVAETMGERPYEVILVDDGSPLETWSTVEGLARTRDHVVGLRLGRNFGQHNALVAGVRKARYPVVVTIDDDLQNPPEEIPKLLAALNDDLDVVYGTPTSISQDRWRRMASVLSRWAMASALGAENAGRMTSFRAFRTDLREAFQGDLGPSVSLDALLSWGTSRFGSVEVEHHLRAEGSSNYTFRRLLSFAIDTATGYSALPLQIATSIGLLTSVFGLGVLVYVLGRLVVSGTAVPGFAFLASTIAIFAGAQLLTLGIMGEYLARMHFRLMRKPTYVLSEQAGRLGETWRRAPADAASSATGPELSGSEAG
jgi:glycosyltransferase involved in cell wall biosynthesis